MIKLAPAVLTFVACAAALAPAHAAHKASPANKLALTNPPAVLPAASTQQLSDADRALYGHYACEFNQSVDLNRNETHPGYINLSFKKKVWVMKPVLSSTGALRVEDVKGQLLFLQTAYKSMLMDVKSGHRVVDACVHPAQLAAEEAATTKNAQLLN